MAVQEHQVGHRLLRFWRMTLKSTLVLGLLAGLTVYSARIPDRYVCLQLVSGYGGGNLTFDLVDLNSGVDMPDPRRQPQPFGLSSPDGTLLASAQPSQSGPSASDLVIQRIGGQQAAPSTIVVQSGIGDLGTGFNRFRNIRWSPDSARLAYIWSDTDQQTYLSVVNADGSGRQSALLPNAGGASNSSVSSFGFGRNGFGGDQGTLTWSADHAFLSADESAAGGTGGYSVWSAADLQRVYPEDNTTLRVGGWSPRADQFAAIGEDENSDKQLVIWTPAKIVKIPLDTPGKVPDQIVWSPTGQFLALQSHSPCQSWEQCTTRWNFDIFGSDGTLLAGNLHGAGWNSAGTSQSAGSPSVAVWSPDGASWVFLQERSSTDTKDLVALHVAGQRNETLASNIVSDLTGDMLNVSMFSRRGFGPRQSNVSAQRIILPTWRDGKVTVELSDIDGKNRTTLVQGADEILDPGFTTPGNSNHFWPFNSGLVVVVWATIDGNTGRHVHLTWSQIDGTDLHQIDDPLQAVSHVQVATRNGQKWLGYLAERKGDLGVEVADVETGSHYRLLSGLETEDRWTLIPAPAGNLAAIQFGATNGRSYGESTLRLVALDGSWEHDINAQVVGGAQWSPDGTKLAFLHHDTSNTTTLAGVVSADGDIVQDVPVHQQAGNTQLRLYRWSQCM